MSDIHIYRRSNQGERKELVCMNSARPRGVDGARVIQVIETKAMRGTGVNEEDKCREVKQYWDFDGNLLAENDPCTKEKE